MIWVLAITQLVFALAVVALAAAVRELGRRPSPGDAVDLDATKDLAGARIGTSVTPLPGQLATLGENAVIVVLSPTCTSCRAVADQLDLAALQPLKNQLGVLVSAPDSESATALLDQLSQWPSALDMWGELAFERFGIDSSPSAVVIRDGEVVDAFVFMTALALLERAQGAARRTNSRDRHEFTR